MKNLAILYDLMMISEGSLLFWTTLYTVQMRRVSTSVVTFLESFKALLMTVRVMYGSATESRLVPVTVTFVPPLSVCAIYTQNVQLKQTVYKDRC